MRNYSGLPGAKNLSILLPKKAIIITDNMTLNPMDSVSAGWHMASHVEARLEKNEVPSPATGAFSAVIMPVAMATLTPSATIPAVRI